LDKIAQMPAGPLQLEGYPQSLFAWSQTDAAAAAEWMQQLPEGAPRDAVVNSVSGGIARRFPAIAFTLAQSIGEPGLRDRQLEHVAREWLAIDAPAANAALAAAPLSPRLREQLGPFGR
jgi:hypothetical protein